MTSYDGSYSRVQRWGSGLAPPSKQTQTQDLTERLDDQPHSRMASDVGSGAKSPGLLGQCWH